jgi:hypothetical protein
LNILGSVPYPGYDAQSNAIAPLNGVPQQRLTDPFPGGLVPVVGKTLGRYTNLGGSATWYQQDFSPTSNDRFNVSLQRQLPGRILADITFFMNVGRSAPYTFDLNQVDPRIGYNVKNAINTPVNNPFFGLPANIMPGQLRTQRQVAVSQLLRPYPQYTSLAEALRGGLENRYRSLQMQFQRPFANGFNFVIGYNYNRERNQEFYDEVDFYTLSPTYQAATNARHRITGAAIYELPFGRGRKMFNNMNRVLDGAFGGWSLSGLVTFNTGTFLRFGSATVTGDPMSSVPDGRWFNTSVFSVLPAFTRRTNPLQFDNVMGPSFHQIDTTLAKEFKITERVKFELRMEAYNLGNQMRWNNPDTSVTSGNFGRLFQQRPGVFGRQLQYSARFIW